MEALEVMKLFHLLQILFKTIPVIIFINNIIRT